MFDVYNDYLELPDGRDVVYDLIKHHPGACILPVKDDGSLILIKQYRNSIDDIPTRFRLVLSMRESLLKMQPEENSGKRQGLPRRLWSM